MSRCRARHPLRRVHAFRQVDTERVLGDARGFRRGLVTVEAGSRCDAADSADACEADAAVRADQADLARRLLPRRRRLRLGRSLLPAQVLGARDAATNDHVRSPFPRARDLFLRRASVHAASSRPRAFILVAGVVQHGSHLRDRRGHGDLSRGRQDADRTHRRRGSGVFV